LQIEQESLIVCQPRFFLCTQQKVRRLFMFPNVRDVKIDCDSDYDWSGLQQWYVCDLQIPQHR